MISSRYGAFLLFVLLALAHAGCGEREERRKEGEAFRVTDDLGRIVSLEKRPARIVSLAPSVTETIFFLGAGDRLVGVTTQCDWPPAARGITKIGDFSNPSIERILELSPDLVVTTSLEQERSTQRLISLGMPVFRLYPRDCTELVRGMERLIEVLGETRGGEDSLRALEGRLVEIEESVKRRERLAGEGEGRRPRVFIEISESPLMTAGRDSFVSDLIERAGGRNVFGILERDYCTVSAERVVEADPEVIFIFHELATKEELAGRMGWEEIEAVRTRRVYDHVASDLVLRPGPRAVGAIVEFRGILHGES